MYHTCITVPGSEFRKSWERDLFDQGFNCVHTDFGDVNRPVVLIRLDPENSEDTSNTSGTATAEPKKEDKTIASSEAEAGLQRVLKGKDTPLGPRWIEDEYKLLIKLWNEHKKVGDIAAKFPNRSGHAVACALARLKKSGAIKPRWTQKKNRFEKEPVVKPPAPGQSETQEHPSEPLKSSLACNVSIHVEAKSAGAIKAVIALLREMKESK